MEHILSVWPLIANQLRNARHILLLSDYDGTLTPIVDKPELAVLSDETRRLLQELVHKKGVTVGIISGRALSDVKDMVNIEGMIYAGNHGLEIEGPGIRFVNPVADELRPVLRVMHYMLSRALGTVKGVFVENKGLTLSIHYRLAEDRKAGDVETIIKQVAGGVEASGQARITTGKKVYEVRPRVIWDKGKAVKLLMKRFGKGGRNSGLAVIYLGDDLTDEDGFQAIENYGNGISVFVGEPTAATSAHYYLKSPDEVNTFLDALAHDI